MASYFNLTLDTLGPQSVTLSINSGAVKTSTELVDLAISTSDSPTTGYQMKLWGDITDGATEEAVSWQTFSAAPQVTLTTGDGSKTVYVRLRDDVYNESSQISSSITLDSAVPIVTVYGPDHSKISKVSGKDEATITWECDSDFVEYKVCVVPSENSIQSEGTVIGTDSGSTGTSGTGTWEAGDTMTTVINGADLEAADAGDTTKIVKVFVKNDVNTWSV